MADEPLVRKSDLTKPVSETVRQAEETILGFLKSSSRRRTLTELLDELGESPASEAAVSYVLLEMINSKRVLIDEDQRIVVPSGDRQPA